MFILSLLVAAAIGGLAFRLHASELWERWTGQGHHLACLMWATVMAGLALAFTREPWAVLLVPAFWLGAKPGYPGCLDLGRLGGNPSMIHGPDWRRDALWMLLRGIVFVAPAVAVLLALQLYAGVALRWWPLLLAGALAPLALEIAWRIRLRAYHARQGPPLYDLLFGAALAASLAFLR